MATMTMTFDIPENKVLDKKAFTQKLSDFVQFVIASLPDAEQDETEYVMSNPELMNAIKEGDKQVASGNYKTTKLEDLWN